MTTDRIDCGDCPTILGCSGKCMKSIEPDTRTMPLSLFAATDVTPEMDNAAPAARERTPAHRRARALRTLRKRRDYVREKVDTGNASEGALGHHRAELSALDWALKHLEWQPIETAPEGVQLVVFWVDPTGWPGEQDRYDFDMLEDGCWLAHANHHEHYLMVGGPFMGPGPGEKAPYTHWMMLVRPFVPKVEAV